LQWKQAHMNPANRKDSQQHVGKQEAMKRGGGGLRSAARLHLPQARVVLVAQPLLLQQAGQLLLVQRLVEGAGSVCRRGTTINCGSREQDDGAQASLPSCSTCTAATRFSAHSAWRAWRRGSVQCSDAPACSSSGGRGSTGCGTAAHTPASKRTRSTRSPSTSALLSAAASRPLVTSSRSRRLRWAGGGRGRVGCRV
jgi:hypothetical protein